MQLRVTLKAELRHGELYWVTEVDCEDEEKAVSIAQQRFLEQFESDDNWEFSEFDLSRK